MATFITTRSAALKEWAVAIRALNQGRQVAVIRKGGIDEKRFDLPASEFYLYPTYYHPTPELLQEPFHGLLAEVEAERPSDSVVRIAAYAQIAEVLPIVTIQQLQALAPQYCWTPAYVEERFRWRRTQPLQCLILRAYRLRSPLILPSRADYGGCRSWIELQGVPDKVELEPALTEAEFEERRSTIRQILID